MKKITASHEEVSRTNQLYNETEHPITTQRVLRIFIHVYISLCATFLVSFVLFKILLFRSVLCFSSRIPQKWVNMHLILN